jgi:hypothetical protein
MGDDAFAKNAADLGIPPDVIAAFRDQIGTDLATKCGEDVEAAFMRTASLCRTDVDLIKVAHGALSAALAAAVAAWLRTGMSMQQAQSLVLQSCKATLKKAGA